MALVYLRLVAPRRTSWLGLMALSAVVLAACTTGQTTPTTTSTTTVKTTSAGAVARFLAEASRGDDQTFVATYHRLGSGNQPQVFEFAQQPHGPGSTKPFGAGSFMYIAHEDGQSHKFVQRDHGDYECVRNGHGPWSCGGPNPNISNGYILRTLDEYDEQTALAQDEPTPPADAAMATKRLNGLIVTCLVGYRYLGTRPRTTWCITADGITALASSTLWGAVEVVKLSTSVSPGLFSLPARPTPWHGWERWRW